MIIIAHRGAATEAVENSMDAFFKSIKIGARRIELDIQHLKDKTPVVIHDEDLKRVTGHDDIFLKDIVLADLEKYLLLNKEVIPTLQKVLDQILPKIELNIEIKDSTISLLDHVLKITPVSNRVIFSSFDKDIVKFLKKNNTHQVALLWGEDNANEFEPISFLKEHNFSIFHPQADFLEESMVKELKKMGCVIYPWVSLSYEKNNKIALWEKLSNWGIDGLCTNFPREMLAWVKSNKFK